MPPAAEKTGPPILLHTGELSAGRRVGSFCRAVALLIQSNRLSPDAVRAVFMGATESEIEAEARASAPEMFARGTLAFQSRMNWRQAQQSVSQADVLLIFQGDHPTAIPAKFFEYLQSGKPILAIAQEGALKEIILRTGSGVVADPQDVTAIASAIEQVLKVRPRSRQEVEAVARTSFISKS